MVEERDAVVYGLTGIGSILVIIGLYIQGWVLNGAQNWGSNDLYLAGAILIIIGLAIARFWED